MSYPEEREQNVQVRRIAAVLVVVVLLTGIAWWWLHRPAPPPQSQPQPVVAAPAASPAPDAAAAPAIRHPLDVAPPAPAAAGADPDAMAGSELTQLFGSALDRWLIPDMLVRRLVGTVDNLPRNTRIEPLRPLHPPSTPFAVQRQTVDAAEGTERISIAPANAARYDAVVGLLAKVDPQQAVAAYRRLYPQLQKAYEDLGYPGHYFNDRVVEAIDDLLATPEPAGSILLEQPKVLYRFADADLESRSAGQKLLLRMGVDHERVVKEKLKAIRALIASKEQ